MVGDQESGHSVVGERIVNVAPGAIEPTDEFGREERSESGAKRAFRRLDAMGGGRAPVARFKPPRSSNEISVNRMGLAPEDHLAEIGKKNAKPLNKSFWGWYILFAGDIEAVGCSVSLSSLADNPYHADIIIPVALDAEDTRDTLIEFARDLAYHARFRPWGDWTKELQAYP